MSLLRRPNETYGLHPIAAATGTHSRIAELVSRHVEDDRCVLDLGAYTGALIARLRDAGYTRLSGADLSRHIAEEVDAFWKCDFNGPFADEIDRSPFECITACEVIEHLDNPRAFLRQCHQLLAPGGTLVISTPNIQFFEARIKFALTGELWGFSERSYRSQRHISPVLASHVPMMLRECGFACREVSTGASFASPLRRLLTFPIWGPMRLLLGPMVLGETLFIVATAMAQVDAAAPAGQSAWQAGNDADRQGEN